MRGRPITEQPVAEPRDSTRILHLTDPHLFADPAGQLRGTTTYESLQQVLEHYRAGSWRADLVYVTGDIVHDDSALAYRHFCDLLGTLGLPVYTLPGNHDVRALMRVAMDAANFSYCEAYVDGNWALLPLDSCVDQRAGGHLSAEQLRQLDERLQDVGPRHVLVCIHHPPVAMGSRWLDGVGLDNAAGLLELLQEHEHVRGVIFGHVHQSVDTMRGNLRILGTPSTCNQFLPRSDEFAIDDRPPAYRRLTLEADGRIDTRLVWLDE